MSIILDEHKYAKEVLRSKDISDSPFKSLKAVARYYLDDGYSKNEVTKRLESFILQCDPDAIMQKWDDIISVAIKYAQKRPAIKIDSIDITDREIETINSVKGTQSKRLAFTLLCIAKYHHAVNSNNDYWVHDDISEIMNMANIKTSIRRQGAMYKDLIDRGLIESSKKIDNNSVRVHFVSDGEVVMSITDFRNLGYQFLKYCGGPFYTCDKCGIVSKHRSASSNEKFCKSCAREELLRSRVNAVSRYRSNVKSDNGYIVYMHESCCGKKYFGVTASDKDTCADFGHSYKNNKRFFDDITMYGWDSFRHVQCTDRVSKDEAVAIRNYLISHFKSDDPECGYNRYYICKTDISMLTNAFTDEIKKIM